MNSIFSKKTKEENTTYDTMPSLSHTKQKKRVNQIL